LTDSGLLHQVTQVRLESAESLGTAADFDRHRLSVLIIGPATKQYPSSFFFGEV
jgi:hypothetical protein